jgi:Family of unknown function (DUF5670)
MLGIIAAVLIVLCLLGFFAFHVSSGLIHILLVIGIVKPRSRIAPQPSTWRGRSEQISLDQVGCEARKIPAEGAVFFLDFSLYRTNRE